MKLRDYQSECLDVIKKQNPGKYLVQMATGLGKTVTFAQLENIFTGRILIISHREELVTQPRKYFKSSFGIEQAKNKSNGERIVSACIQSLVRRFEKFSHDDFEVIIVDEAHHTPARTYQKVIKYFSGAKYLFGFTATPNRGDKIGLRDTYQEIIFEKDLRWGIKNKYLSDIECKRVNIEYDLSKVKTTMGDYNVDQLAEAVNIEEANNAIADAYYKLARGQTLIFGINVAHCYAIHEKIEDSVVVDGKTKSADRQEIINKFTNREIKCLINCMVFTEGTDMPLIETIIFARPTKNPSLYTQAVGRGLRLAEGKEKLLLIDCIGVSEELSLCSAPTLIGLKMDDVEKDVENEIEGDLFELEDKIIERSDNPKAWIRNIKTVDLWGKQNEYNLHGVNYFKMPNGDLVLNISGLKFTIKKPDELGNTIYHSEKIPMQKMLDKAYLYLEENKGEQRPLWDVNIFKRWGSVPASEKQLKIINKKLKDFDTKNLTKGEASLVLNRLFV